MNKTRENIIDLEIEVVEIMDIATKIKETVCYELIDGERIKHNA